MQTTDLGAGRGWLDAPAAASIHRIDRALGHPMQVTEAGRTWARQNEHYQAYRRYLAGGPWAPIALSPDAPSIHQLGNAIDSDEAQQHVALMEEHGWIRTVYRGGKLVEPWHFEYFIRRDKHLNDPTPTPATTQEDDMPIIITQRSNSKLTKARYLGGNKVQEITTAENNMFRAVQSANPDAVVYATVTDADYASFTKVPR